MSAEERGVERVASGEEAGTEMGSNLEDMGQGTGFDKVWRLVCIPCLAVS